MLESLFNKVAGLQACNFIKRRLNVWYCEICKNSYFEEHLRTTASINNILNFNFVGTCCWFDPIQFVSYIWFTFFEMIYLYFDTWFTCIWFTFFGLFEYPEKECQSWIKDYFPYYLSSCNNIIDVFKNIFFAEIHRTKRQTFFKTCLQNLLKYCNKKWFC